MARKNNDAPADAAPPRPLGKNEVAIRMYCQGLGDCFLLSFPREQSHDRYHVLIDCGVLQRTPRERERLIAVANDIAKVTGNAIDLLIVTHEHWDHVAGFSHANDVFEKMEIKNVWLSWAENSNDADAKIVKSELGKKKALVKRALAMAPAFNADKASQVDEEIQSARLMMDSFFGPGFEAADGLGLAGGAKPDRMSLGETMDWLRAKVTLDNYCLPGQRRRLPGLEWIGAYVLGPPKDVKRIRKMNPNKSEGYHFNLSLNSSLEGAMMARSGQPTPKPADLSPFEERYGIGIDEARCDPFFRDFYGFEGDPIGDDKNDWRKIDGIGLSDLGRFALQLDTGVNNTSLALAFELPNGRTLIFPGDAQVGNWKSWNDHEYRTKDGQPIAGKTLLNKAVFYKCGHHGSHNATLREGLESMTSGDLISMIPTDQSFALQQGQGWKMPFYDLYQLLKRFTNHRIARADFNFDETIANLKEDSVGEAPEWLEDRIAFAESLEFAEQPLLPEMPHQPMWVQCRIAF